MKKTYTTIMAKALAMAAMLVFGSEAQAIDYPTQGTYKLQNVMTGMYAAVDGEGLGYLDGFDFGTAAEFLIEYDEPADGMYPELTAVTSNGVNMVKNIEDSFFEPGGEGTQAVNALVANSYGMFTQAAAEAFMRKLMKMRLVPLDEEGSAWCVASQMPTKMTTMESRMLSALKIGGQTMGIPRVVELTSVPAGGITSYVTPYSHKDQLHFNAFFPGQIEDGEVSSADWPNKKPKAIVGFYLRKADYTEPALGVTNGGKVIVKAAGGNYLNEGAFDAAKADAEKVQLALSAVNGREAALATAFLPQVAAWRTDFAACLEAAGVADDAAAAYLDKLLAMHVEAAIDADNTHQFFLQARWNDETADEAAMRQAIATQFAGHALAQWLGDDNGLHPTRLYVKAEEGQPGWTLDRSLAAATFTLEATEDDTETAVLAPAMRTAAPVRYMLDGRKAPRNARGVMVVGRK